MLLHSLRSAFICSCFLAPVLLVAGCGSMGFLGKRYDNFTAYYNGFYNAERVYAKGQEGLNRTVQPVDRTQFHSVFERQTGNTSSRDFESAVKKSADLLREHPDSKWVDDALLLIGKSYFFQENFVGAEQKFREVMLVSEDEAEEARFWLARTLITSGALEEARTVLTEGVASDGLSAHWKAMFELTLGELAVQEGAMEEAAMFLEAGLRNVRDKEAGARAQFLYGQVLETVGQPQDAVRAYDRVLKYRYPFELGYAAMYSAARVLGMKVNAEDGLDRVRKMERDDKNVDATGELRLLRGKILQGMGRVDDAYAIYDGLLYEENPDPSVARVRSKVHLAMAEFYREVEGDFVMASAYFDSAATGLSPRGAVRSGAASRQAPTFQRNSDLSAPEAVGDINDIRSSFSAFATAYTRIAEMDSLLYLGSLPQDEFDQRVLAMRQARALELAEMQRRKEADRRNSQFQQQQQRGGQDDPFQNQGLLPEGKIIPGVNDGVSSNVSGFLYFEDPIRVQEGVATFRERWGDRPLIPNWRREEVVRSSGDRRVDAGNGAEDGGESGVNSGAVLEGAGNDYGDSGLPQIDLSGIPRDSTARAEVRSRRALARYDVGNTLFLNMNMPDSAAAWYRLIVDEDADQPVARRALYALAEVQWALGDDQTANRLYREVLDRYPDSEFSTIVALNLGLDSIDVAADSTFEAKREYEIARNRIENGVVADHYRTYLTELLHVAARWKEQTVAAQSLLTAARVHLEWADSDSVRIVGPLSISPEDSSVLSLWPDRAVLDSSELNTRGAESSILDEVAEDSVVFEGVSAELVLSDSLGVERTRPDSLVARSAPVPDSLYLGDLYSWVKEKFVGTPYFSEADRLARVLDEFKKPPVDEKEVARQLSANDSLVMAILRGEQPLSLQGSARADSALLDSALLDSALLDSALLDSALLDGLGEEPDESQDNEGIREVPLIPSGIQVDSSQVVVREDMWPVTEGNESSVQGEGFWLVLGGDHVDEQTARQNTSLLKRLLMGEASRVRILRSVESEEGTFVTAIGPFATASDAASFHAARETILRERIRLFQLIAP